MKDEFKHAIFVSKEGVTHLVPAYANMTTCRIKGWFRSKKGRKACRFIEVTDERDYEIVSCEKCKTVDMSSFILESYTITCPQCVRFITKTETGKVIEQS